MNPAPRAAKTAWITLALIALGGPGIRAEPGSAGPGDVPICLSTLELEPGRAGPEPAQPPVRVRVRYRAVSLSAATLEAMRTHSRAQAFYNARVLRRLVQLTTDVPLLIGKTRLEAGTHDAGFRCQGQGRWRFLVLDREGRPRVDVPLTITRAEAEIPCLNVSLLPGTEKAHILLAARYGTLRGSLVLAVADLEKAAPGK